ncbi:MAG TPA: immunoglobulin domain-containing protein, partial [Bacteroidia bacterium]|nr:immunoglobulin domain-containing protein [Bacteroidia bacterium]
MSISTATITVAPQAGTAVDLSQNPGSTAGAVANGFLLPYLTTTQMNAISSSAPAGLLIFNSTVNCYEIYSGVVWNPFWCLCSGVPSITAGAVSTSVCTGSTISLTSSGGASTYSWTGPNGFTSTLQNPTIANAVLADAGTYSVTASNGCGSSPVSTVTISVSAGTTVTAGVSASPICAG